MSTPLVATHTQERTRMPALRSVMIAGLVGNVVMNVIVQALIVQELIVPLTIISVLTLVRSVANLAISITAMLSLYMARRGRAHPEAHSRFFKPVE